MAAFDSLLSSILGKKPSQPGTPIQMAALPGMEEDPKLKKDLSGQPMGNPFSNALSAVQGQGMGNGQGSISGMIAKLMGNQPLAGAPMDITGGQATTDQMSPQPTATQPQPAMAPKTYAQPSALPVESIPELRSSLYVGAGLNPDLASPETTRGVIKGNLSDSEMTGMSTTDIPAGADPMTFAKGLSQ